MKRSELRHIIREEISKILIEAESKQQLAPVNWPRTRQDTYDWRTQQKGNHWKTASGKWGARSLKGVVRYFDDEAQAREFSQSQAGDEFSENVNEDEREGGIFHQKSLAFDVFLNGKEIDTVFALVDPTSIPNAEREVKQSLVNHDGYDPRIVVKRAKK